MKKELTLIFAAALVACSFGTSFSVAQDLSDDINSPDVFTIGSGGTSFSLSNTVVESDLSTGVTGNSAADIDFFNVIVEDGFQLDSINLDSFSGGGQAFFGFAEDFLGGNSSLSTEQDAFVATALGFTLVNGTETSLFADLAVGVGGTVPGIGFDPTQSLDAGTYAFVFQNTGGNVNSFGLSFSGSAVAVPEPASGLVVIGLGLAGVIRRRR